MSLGGVLSHEMVRSSESMLGELFALRPRAAPVLHTRPCIIEMRDWIGGLMDREHSPAGNDALSSGFITAREERAISALLSAGSIRAASRSSGISERTIYRYLQQEDFRRELTRAHEFIYAGALLRLRGLAGRAVAVLEEVFNDPRARAADRIAAAREVLTWAEKSARKG